MNSFSLITMSKELLEIKEHFGFYVRHKNYDESYFTLETFVQLWESTTGAFGGIGGSAMTEQRTYVFVPKYRIHDDFALVFFGGRFGYMAYSQNKNFIDDLKNCQMASVSDHFKRYE